LFFDIRVLLTFYLAALKQQSFYLCLPSSWDYKSSDFVKILSGEGKNKMKGKEEGILYLFLVQHGAGHPVATH
jgi:hypothetical protein